MRILLILLLIALLALPSYIAGTVTTVGWGSSLAFEAWVLFNTAIVLAMYFSTRNIFSVWGAILLTDYNNHLGYIPIAIALVISIAQIVAGVILYNKKSKK